MINLKDKKWLGIPIVFLVLLTALTTGGIALASTVFYQAHVNFSVIDGLAVNYDNTTNWDTATATWSPPAVYPNDSVFTSLTIYNNSVDGIEVFVDTVVPNPEIEFIIEWEDSNGFFGTGNFTVPPRDGTPGYVHLDIILTTSSLCPAGDYDLTLSLSR